MPGCEEWTNEPQRRGKRRYPPAAVTVPIGGWPDPRVIVSTTLNPDSLVTAICRCGGWLGTGPGRLGSAIAVVTWLAALGFVLYNALMFVFATPVNRLFLLYLVMLSLAAWSAGTLLWHTDTQALGRLIPARAPVRLAAGYLWALVALNGGAWLVRILPSLTGSGEPAYLRGTGMTTNIVYVQDLALWLPLTAVAGNLAVAGRAMGLPARRGEPGDGSHREHQHRGGSVVRARCTG